MGIKVLDRVTIDRIAAGEVIERPASVVKELVENALDAGASRIEIEARGGGTGLIRVTDNGSGIPAEEVALAFKRHATSKISKFQDLHNVTSLGFRGEALPSIAAVARVEMLTCVAGEAAGTFISLNGGAITGRESRARQPGTTFTVRDLFQKVPARLKFLKTPPTENGHIANTVSQYALACPGVAFRLTLEGKTALNTSGRGHLIDAVIEVYGVEMAGKMLPVDGLEEAWSVEKGESRVEVSGMVGTPELGRTGRGYLSFFINRRWVSSRLLSFAVEEAYQGLLMTGRHPVAVLNLSLPPGDIDVNIHPAKSEVKFRNESEVFRAVQRAVRRTLVERMPAPKVEDIAAPYTGVSSQPSHSTAWFGGEAEAAPTEAAPSLLAALPVLRVVGQVLNSYIVAEGPDGLYLVDQHAAHERVRYDRVRGQRSKGRPEVQGLLEPATLEVTPRQDPVMRSAIGDLAGFGFEIDPFGERAYLVRTVPALLAGEDWPSVLRELLDDLAGEARNNWEAKMMASIACHGAVPAGQVLSSEEMVVLVRELEATANPHTCPHGRPTVIRLGKSQLEREFGRG